MIPEIPQKAPIVEIKMNFMLHLGDKLSFIDSTKLNCMQKKQNIINNWRYRFIWKRGNDQVFRY